MKTFCSMLSLGIVLSFGTPVQAQRSNGGTAKAVIIAQPVVAMDSHIATSKMQTPTAQPVTQPANMVGGPVNIEAGITAPGTGVQFGHGVAATAASAPATVSPQAHPILGTVPSSTTTPRAAPQPAILSAKQNPG